MLTRGVWNTYKREMNRTGGGPAPKPPSDEDMKIVEVYEGHPKFNGLNGAFTPFKDPLDDVLPEPGTNVVNDDLATIDADHIAPVYAHKNDVASSSRTSTESAPGPIKKRRQKEPSISQLQTKALQRENVIQTLRIKNLKLENEKLKKENKNLDLQTQKLNMEISILMASLSGSQPLGAGYLQYTDTTTNDC